MPDEAHEHIHVGAPLDRCVGIATDFERYPTWAKDVKAARVLDRDDVGRGRRVEYRIAALGMSVRNVLDYAYDDAGRGFSWHLVEGDMLRALDGRYTFEPDGGGTRVTYDLAVDLAVPLPGLLKRRAAGRIVGAALKDLKHAAESAVTG